MVFLLDGDINTTITHYALHTLFDTNHGWLAELQNTNNVLFLAEQSLMWHDQDFET